MLFFKILFVMKDNMNYVVVFGWKGLFLIEGLGGKKLYLSWMKLIVVYEPDS